MASSPFLNLTILLTLTCILSSVAARDAPLKFAHLTLEERLPASGVVDCWGALMELRLCTNKIILFFLNRESYLGMDCCRAIRVITLRSWPSMLSSIGFTEEEGDILRGYCDASASPGSPPALVASPPALVAPSPVA